MEKSCWNYWRNFELFHCFFRIITRWNQAMQWNSIWKQTLWSIGIKDLLILCCEIHFLIETIGKRSWISTIQYTTVVHVCVDHNCQLLFVHQRSAVSSRIIRWANAIAERSNEISAFGFFFLHFNWKDHTALCWIHYSDRMN